MDFSQVFSGEDDRTQELFNTLGKIAGSMASGEAGAAFQQLGQTLQLIVFEWSAEYIIKTASALPKEKNVKMETYLLASIARMLLIMRKQAIAEYNSNNALPWDTREHFDLRKAELTLDAMERMA